MTVQRRIQLAGRSGTSVRQRGVTLVELMLALSIGALVTGLAVPALTGLMAGKGLTTSTNQLIADMTLARSEAVRRSGGVVICSSHDGKACSGSADWGDGWILFVEQDGSAPASHTRHPVIDAGDEIIRVTRRAKDGLRLGASHAYVVYQADGTTRAF